MDWLWDNFFRFLLLTVTVTDRYLQTPLTACLLAACPHRNVKVAFGHKRVGNQPEPQPWNSFSGMRALLTVVAYLAIGVTFYTTFEDKECEFTQSKPLKPWWKPFAKEPAPVCREPWTLVDAIYFCTVTMSTVGYGDMSPTSEISAQFTLVYIFIGISIVFVEISDASSGIMMKSRDLTLQLLDRFDATPKGLVGRRLGISGKPIDIDGNGQADFVAPPPAWIYWIQEMSIIGTLMLLTQLGSAAVFTIVQPDLSFSAAIYHCIISATTVGYGDVDLTTQASRLWAW